MPARSSLDKHLNQYSSSLRFAAGAYNMVVSYTSLKTERGVVDKQCGRYIYVLMEMQLVVGTHLAISGHFEAAQEPHRRVVLIWVLHKPPVICLQMIQTAPTHQADCFLNFANKHVSTPMLLIKSFYLTPAAMYTSLGPSGHCSLCPTSHPMSKLFRPRYPGVVYDMGFEHDVFSMHRIQPHQVCFQPLML